MPTWVSAFSHTTPTATTITTNTLAQVCSLTCTAGTACVTVCADQWANVVLPAGTIVRVIRNEPSASAWTGMWMDDTGWLGEHDDPQWAQWRLRQRPTAQELDQALYDRAVAEHNDQEAERLRRVMAAREEARQRTAAVETERQRLAAEQAALRLAATDRAHQFLMEHLTAKQRETFTKNGWFVVEGGRSKEQYRIHINSAAGNIRVMKGKNKQQLGDRLCCHADHGAIPLGDQLLAQKLMLEFAEDDFLRIANRTAA